MVWVDGKTCATPALRTKILMQPDKHHHHRKRRFHRPREALGLGFNDYVPAPLSTALETQSEPGDTVSEASPQIQDYHQQLGKLLRKLLVWSALMALAALWLYSAIHNWLSIDPHTGNDWPALPTTRAR
jgi:hypothetical protein